MNPEDNHGVYDNDDQKPVTRPQLRGLEEDQTTRSNADDDVAGADQAAGVKSGSKSQGGFLKKKEKAAGATGGLFNAAGEGPAASSGMPGAEEVAAAATAAAASIEPGGIKSAGTKMTKFFFGSKKRKRNSAAGGITVVAVGGVLVGGTLLSGPFEFMHMAQMLQQFHFAEQQDESDARLSKMMRYARYAPNGDAYKTNLNYMGNKLADRFEARLNKQGLKSAYTKYFGIKEGYVIDRDNQRFQGKSDEQIKRELQGKYGNKITFSEITGEDGKTYLKMDQPSGYRTSRAITRETLREAGNGRITSAIGARIMGVRDGVSWHPLKKLDNKVYKTLDEKLKAWNEERTKNISEGVPDNPGAAADPQDKEGESQAEKDRAAADAGATAAEGEAVANEGSQLSEETRAGGDIDGKGFSTFRESINTKVAGVSAAGTVGVAGVLCMARGIAETADTKKDDQVAKPLKRTGMWAVARGNQTPTGQDVEMAQLALESKQLYNPKNNKSWYDARSIQAEEGHPERGVKADETLQNLNSGSPLDFLVSGTPIADALNPICSTAGQIVQGVVGFLGGPVSFIGGTLVSAAVGPPIIDAIAQYLSGQAVNLNPRGPQYGNYSNYGVFLAANDQALSSAGRQLSPEETGQLADITNDDYKAQFEQHNLAYRLFNPTDRMSLVSGIMDRQSNSVSGNVNNMAMATLNVRESLVTTFGNIFSGVGRAANSQPYNYGGVAKVGFSEAEMDDPNTANPYVNGDDAATAILDSNGQNGVPDYIGRANECFGAIIEQISVPGPNGGTNQVWDVKYSHDSINTFSADYKAKSGDCNSTDPDWLRVRFFVFDTQNMKSANCFEGDDESCREMGFGDSSAGSGSGTGTGTATVSGNAQQLAQQILDNPNIQLTGSHDVEDMQNTANGKPAYNNVKLDIGILQFLLDVASQGQITVTSITGGGAHHSEGSNHYTGNAIDLGCVNMGNEVEELNKIAAKYNGTNNGERCDRPNPYGYPPHDHYDFDN